MSARALFCNDLRLQWRHGFFAAYAFVIAAYVLLVLQLRAPDRGLPLTILTFTELSVIGFFFAGALLMLERGDGVVPALAVTPPWIGQRLAARAMAFLALSLAAIVPLVALAGAPFRPLPLVAAAILTTPLFTFLGIWAAARFETIERFVVWGGLLTAGLGLPALALLPALDGWHWAVVPTYGTLLLLRGTFAGRPPTAMEWGYAVAALAIASVAATRLARRALIDRAARG